MKLTISTASQRIALWLSASVLILFLLAACDRYKPMNVDASQTVETSTTKDAASGKAKRYPDAFVYHWRIWSIPEVRDAMMDAGFRAVDVYARMGDAIDSDGNLYVSPIQSGDELDENYVVYVVGRR